jgi:hypothetical protein
MRSISVACRRALGPDTARTQRRNTTRR